MKKIIFFTKDRRFKRPISVFYNLSHFLIKRDVEIEINDSLYWIIIEIQNEIERKYKVVLKIII